MATRTIFNLGTLLLIINFLYIYYDTANSSYIDSRVNTPKESLSCKLYDMIDLDCSHRTLKEIPSLEKWTPTTLDLSFNRIHYINATSFPESFVALKKLDMRNNQLPKINNGVFQPLGSLTQLQLSLNNISKLLPEGFLGLNSLQDLSLSDNHLSSLPYRVFTPTSKLLKLNLRNNHLTDIPNEALASLRLLEMLDLRGNLFTTFTLRSAFKHLSRLSELYFGTINTCANKKDTFHHLSDLPVASMAIEFPKNCQVHADIFKPLSYLKNFEVHLPNTTSLRSLNSPLDTLTIEARNLPDVLNASILSPLRILPLKKLNIILPQSSSSHLVQDMFTNFPQLKELKISGRRKDLFLTNDSFKGLNSLKHLDLSHNILAATQIKTLFSIFGSHKSLAFLDLSFTSLNGIFHLDSVPDGIQTLDLSGNYFIALNCSARKQYSISELIMEDMMPGMFDLRIIFTQYIYALQILRMAQMKSAPIEVTFDYPICLKAPNIKLINVSSVHGHWTPASALGQNCGNLENLDISDTHVVDYYQLDVSYPKLSVLKASSNGFESFDQVLFIKAPKLQFLDLSNNRIEKINEDDIHAFANLTQLNLEYNRLTLIQSLKVLRSLKILKLSNNFIYTVPNYILPQNKSNHFQQLDLSNNPFHCNCTIVPFKDWILSDKYTHLIPGNGYHCSTPVENFGIGITMLTLQCKSHFAILTLVTSITSANLCCIIAFLLFCLRKQIKYRCITFFRGRSPPPYRDMTNETLNHNASSICDSGMSIQNFQPRTTGYTFDAYVAYHTNNYNWIEQELVPHIEKGTQPHRLCLPIRDLPYSTNEIDQITETIEKSAKVIVLLSKDFVQDEMAKIEVLMAHTKSKNENLNILIFILFEEIHAEEMPKFFKKVMYGKNKLVWPGEKRNLTENLEDVFWSDLRRELGKPV